MKLISNGIIFKATFYFSIRTLNSGCHDDDDDEMMLTPSDVSFDKTDEDVFENIDPIYSRPRKRPSAPPFDDNDAGGGGGQDKKSDSNLNNNGYYNPYNNKENVWSSRKPDKQTKKHRRSKSADLMMTESGLSSVEGQVTPARNKRNSSPFSSPFIRNNSQGAVHGGCGGGGGGGGDGGGGGGGDGGGGGGCHV